MCLPKAEVECDSKKKGKYGLNYDEQAKLTAEEVSRKRNQRLLQVREQEKEFARVNRQAYEQRLSQERKRLYAELLQKWDRQQQEELQSLQDAYQKAVDEASAAQEQADEAAVAAQKAEAAAAARRAIQADLAAQRSTEAAQRVMKQQEAQRRAAEEARERLKRRGRDSVYDFRFTRFHETGLEQQIVPELPNEDPSLADSAEMRARKAARRAEQSRAAEERGRAALHKLHMERAARHLTAQLEAELQARRSAAAAAPSAPSNPALQPLRGMGTGSQQAPAERPEERHFHATSPSFGAAQPALCQAAWHGTVAPNLAALPHATWPQPTPWPAQRHPMYTSTEAHSAAASLPSQFTDRHSAWPPLECQPATTRPTCQPADRRSLKTSHEYQPAAAAAGVTHEPTGRVASLADKMTQCPEVVDRQTQTESPEPDRLPASRVPRPYPLHRLSVPGRVRLECPTETAPAAGAHAAYADTSLPTQHPPQKEAAPGTGRGHEGHGASSGSAQPSGSSVGGDAPAAAHSTSARCNAPEAGAAAGQQDTGNDCSGEIPKADTVGVPTEDMVRTLPGELSDSCCSSRATSVACLADLAPEAAAQPPHAAERPRCAAAPQRNSLQEVPVAACNPADAACTITIAARGTTSAHQHPAANKDQGRPEKPGSAVVLPQEGVGKSDKLAALHGVKEPVASHMSGAKLSTRSGLAEGRSVKTALQKAEELLARLTADAAAWDTIACSATPPQPTSKEQQPESMLTNPYAQPILVSSKDADGADIFSCSGDDAASDLPFDALSLGSTQLGTPLSGGREDGWLSDVESLDLEDSCA
ncbi:probable centrosomal protein of 295 kDa at N-terminal half [Coccomyxa sp. Obi]|nr:probable centrosomal protein of 295 kDa at N-terminal half [Coccomyxa sp. Obi]